VAQWFYAGCWCVAVVGGVCVESWCPPPVFPDLLAAFAGSLGHSPAMRNLTVELLSPGSPAATPCRHLLDCCLPPPDSAAPRRRPCSVDRLPPLPSCRTRSRDPDTSGRERPVQFSRSLEVASTIFKLNLILFKWLISGPPPLRSPMPCICAQRWTWG